MVLISYDNNTKINYGDNGNTVENLNDWMRKNVFIHERPHEEVRTINLNKPYIPHDSR